jgi:uncharacterized protein (UPF0218 family)
MEYSFPSSLRKWVANPKNLLGHLFPGKPEVAIPKALEWIEHDQSSDSVHVCPQSKKNIITIGDIVSKEILRYSSIHSRIKYCFYDEKTQRDEYLPFNINVNWEKITLENPRSKLNSRIFHFIEKTWDDQLQYLIEIQGEEDLIVIPAVLKTKNSYILYGQPPLPMYQPSIPAGCVVIKITSAVKSHFQKIFQKMQKCS